MPLQIYWEMYTSYAKEFNVLHDADIQAGTTLKMEVNVNHIFINAVFNLVLILIALNKMMFFMSMSKNFGTMIRLVQNSLLQIREFVIYFLIMICVMSALNKVLGYDISSDNPAGAALIWNYIKHTFIISVGGVDEPNLEFWQTFADREGLEHEGVAKAMEVLIWIAWFSTVFVLFIILCNFMISYISQTYEDVLELKTENTYQTRCDLNYEYYIMLKWWYDVTGRETNFNCFLVTADFDRIDIDPGSQEHTGFTKKIKQNLDEHKNLIKTNMKSQKKEIEDLVQSSSFKNEQQLLEVK